jgi:chorismate mutase
VGDVAVPQSILDLRSSIDAVDSDLASMLERRVSLGRRVVAIKESLGFSSIDPRREAEIVAMVAESSGLPVGFVRRVWSALFEVTRGEEV